MILSIIIPVYNEEKTIGKVLKKVSALNIPDVTKEIIVVNDASTDTTESRIIRQLGPKDDNPLDLTDQNPTVRYFVHKKNLGKGAAVKTGIKYAKGDYIVIQDADEEYNPEDIKRIAKQIKSGNEVIYGTRLNRMPNLLRDEKIPLFLMHYIGNRFLSLVTSLLYGQWITDMETCYKMFPKKAVNSMVLKSRGFEFEAEITAKLMKLGYRIKEISIFTMPRNYNEGKKLHALRDGPKALWTLVRYRLFD